MKVEVGTQVGSYRVLRQIGEGGMGTVWLAEHVMLGRRAAIKLLHPMITARPEFVTRFFNEARAATAISDPGIVQIFDFGYHTDGSAYIAMEMLEGEPLDKRLRRLGRFPVPDALRIMRQIASTLGVAHLCGIVHRDLKPENIYLVHDPEVIGGERAKVLDFGIAKLTGDAGVKTNTSAVMGTPAYMSPEQCRGAGQVDQRSDVYALGCMLFALITGAPPFQAEGGGEIIAMHLRELPPALSSRVPDVPIELEALVAMCLAKYPAQRFASGAELAAAIGRVLGTPSSASLQVTGSVAAVPAAAGGVFSATTLSSSTGAASGTGAATGTGTARSSRGAWFAVLGVLVLGGGVVAVVATRGHGEPGSTALAGSSTAPAGSAIAAPNKAASSPASAPVAPATPKVLPPPPPPDPDVALAKQMQVVLTRFVAWSHDHAGAPCPSSSVLGAAVQDPWGHPIELTCTDQPANQIIGAISAGPDGVPGTPDDVGSWQLGRDVTDVVHGTRWVAAAVVKPSKPRPVPHPRPKASDDDIPTER